MVKIETNDRASEGGVPDLELFLISLVLGSLLLELIHDVVQLFQTPQHLVHVTVRVQDRCPLRFQLDFFHLKNRALNRVGRSVSRHGVSVKFSAEIYQKNFQVPSSLCFGYNRLCILLKIKK